jgi:hypothetical protein
VSRVYRSILARRLAARLRGCRGGSTSEQGLGFRRRKGERLIRVFHDVAYASRGTPGRKSSFILNQRLEMQG